MGRLTLRMLKFRGRIFLYVCIEASQERVGDRIGHESFSQDESEPFCVRRQRPAGAGQQNAYHDESVDLFHGSRIPDLACREGLCHEDRSKMNEPATQRFLRDICARFHFRAMRADSVAFTTAPCPVGSAVGVRARAKQQRQVDDTRTIISALLGCWSEPTLAVARRIGVTKSELDDYLTGQGTSTEDVLARLKTVVGLVNRHIPCADDTTRPATATTSYVLFGGNAPERVSAAYDLLIGGNSNGFSVEIVPRGRAPAPRWRYVVVMRESIKPSLMCLARFGRGARMLERGQLARFRGEHAVAPAFFDAIEGLRTGVEQRPTRALSAMRELCEAWPSDIDEIRTAPSTATT
jgi:hypothetical protein